ncbi:MAG: hypothetical protein EDX89_11910 [Acidobacteria bacterium]|nr:MAG: hypothetical protein EDX89_11910 [Acidobacteriota bacterium]MCE7958379.1 hypothetical protein [Acidobacteria bacterium ACB2]
MLGAVPGGARRRRDEDEMNDRKYRQKGYQDGARGSSESGGSGRPFDAPPTRMEGAPRGRGAERNRDEVFRCKRCGEKGPFEIAADSTCGKCGSALHACVQCRHFDTLARFQCRQPIPAPLAAKSSRNDCTFYEPTIQLDLKGRTAVDTPDAARSAFDKLFGKK